LPAVRGSLLQSMADKANFWPGWPEIHRRAEAHP
jgi:hypothetical protein